MSSSSLSRSGTARLSNNADETNDATDAEYEVAARDLLDQNKQFEEVWINGKLVKTTEDPEVSAGSLSGQSLIKSEKSRKELVPEVPAEKAIYFYKRARRLFAEGSHTSIELERVIRDVLRASQFVPNEVNHYNFMAVVYRKALDLSSAMNCLRVVLRLQPTHASARKQLYEMLVKTGQELMMLAAEQGNDPRYYTGAKIAFESALKIEKYEPMVWTYVAICCVRLSKFKEALDAVNRALNNEGSGGQPPSLELYIVRAKIFWALGFMEPGNKDIRLASTKIPNHPEIEAYTTKAYIKVESLYKQSCIYFNQGNFIEALRNVQFALSVSSEDVKLYVMLAKVHRVMGEFPKAYAAIQRAASAYRDSSEFGTNMNLPEDIVKQTNLIFNEMAMQYANKGDYERAIVLFNKAINSEKTLGKGLTDPDYRYFVNRGDCYRASKKYDLAMMDYKAALDINKADWSIKTKLSLSHYLVAVEYYNQMDFSNCEREITEAINLNSKVSEYFSTRGQVRYLNSDYLGAYSDYQKCLELDPNNEDILLRIKQFQQDQRPLVQDTKSQPFHPILVSKEDMVTMMLSRHDRKKQQNKTRIPVPPVKLRSMVNDDAPPKHYGCPHQSPRVLLPKVNPRFAAPLMVSMEAKLADHAVKRVMNEKTKTAKDNLWSMMTNAKTLAKSREKVSPVQIKLASAVGLKRASQKLALEGMKSAPLSGVIAKNKPSTFKISVSSSSRKSKESDDVTIESNIEDRADKEDVADVVPTPDTDEFGFLLGEKELKDEPEKKVEQIISTKEKKKKKEKKKVRKIRRFDDAGNPLEKVEVYFSDEDDDEDYESDEDDNWDDDPDSQLLHMLAQSGVELDLDVQEMQARLEAAEKAVETGGVFDDSAISSLLISEEEELAMMAEREAHRVARLEEDRQEKIRQLEATISAALDEPPEASSAAASVISGNGGESSHRSATVDVLSLRDDDSVSSKGTAVTAS